MPAQAPDSYVPGQAAGPLDLRRAAALLAGGPPQPEVRWTLLPEGGRFSAPPALGPSGLAVGTSVGVQGGRVALLDPDTGSEKWRADLRHEPEWCAQGPDGTVYVGGRFGFLKALDSADGSVKWEIEVGEHLSEPPVFLPGGRMACLKGGTLQVRDAATGDGEWHARNMFGLRTKALAATPDGGVLVHADNGLFCFEGATGRNRWHREDITTGGVASGGLVWAARGRTLEGLDPATGATRRKAPLTGSPVATPAARGETVFVPLRGSRLVALQGSTELWETNVYTDVPTFLTPVGDDLVLVGNPAVREVFGVDPKSGRRLWTYQGERVPVGRAATDGAGRAWVATHDALAALGEHARLAPLGPEEPPPEIREGDGEVLIGEVLLPVQGG